MESLFAPWRMSVIESYASQKSCVFCELPKLGKKPETLILHQGKSAFVIMNKFPYSNGHLLLVPNRHVGNWTDLSSEELAELMNLSQKAIRVCQKALPCQNFNLGANLGASAGAGIPDHVHMHVVPRWPGDTNFMPVLAETKMISEHIETTYQKLRSVWEAEA